MTDEIEKPRNKGGRPKGSKNNGLRAKIEGHVLRAIYDLESNPTKNNLTELLIKSFETDVKGTLTTVAKYLPKVQVVANRKEDTNELAAKLVRVDETLNRLHGMAQDAADGLEAPTPEKPVLN